MAQGAVGLVTVFDEFRDGLKDLEGFDRIWLVYWFDRVDSGRLLVTPFLDTEQRGIFATRAPARPNPLGLSCVGLTSIDRNLLRVTDIDVVDGTPLLDIKPYVPRFDRFDGSRAGWFDRSTAPCRVADGRFKTGGPDRE